MCDDIFVHFFKINLRYFARKEYSQTPALYYSTYARSLICSIKAPSCQAGYDMVTRPAPAKTAPGAVSDDD